MLVKDVMKTQLVTLNADSKLGFANDIMYLGRIRHLPVVKGETVVGILTQRDLLSRITDFHTYKLEGK